MQFLPHLTHHDGHGPVHTLDLGAGCEIRVVTADGFDRLGSAFVPVHRGRHYDIARCAGGESVCIALRNTQPLRPDQLDRDDTWQRRLELAAVLPDLLAGWVGLSAVELRMLLPLSLLVPSYRAAFPSTATPAEVWATVARNSQRRFDELVPAILDGRLPRDASGYRAHGPRHPDYSHLRHFAGIYAQQIGVLLRLMSRDRGDLTVVDLGTGHGHLLLTLANYLHRAGHPRWQRQLRLVGVDRGDAALRLVRDAFGDPGGVRVELVADDFTEPGFADRLRRLNADMIVANHVVEHLGGDIQNRYLDDWLLAARSVLAISMPLGDDLDSTISGHHAQYTCESVLALARGVEIRTGFAVRAQDAEAAAEVGQCIWIKTDDVVRHGGFGGRTVRLRPRRTAVVPDPVLDDFRRPFDATAFGRARVAPKISDLRDRVSFRTLGQPRQVRQLLIKAPGTDVRIPRELRKFREAVQLVIDHNMSANDLYPRCFAYLNFFQGTTLFSSYRGLSLSCHTDQMQTLQAGYAFRPDWSYIVSSTLPTMLFAQPFDLSDALARLAAGERVNIYDDFNRQAAAEHVYRSDDYGIYLLSPYVVHAAALAEQDVDRVFMKIAFSTKRFFDNRELRRNPAFDNREWYQHDTVGYADGWFSHAHWNERFLKEDMLTR